MKVNGKLFLSFLSVVVLSMALCGCAGANEKKVTNDISSEIHSLRDVLGETGQTVFDNFDPSNCAEIRYTLNGEKSSQISIKDEKTMVSIIEALKQIKVGKTTDEVSSDAEENLLIIMKDNGAMQFDFNKHHLHNTAQSIYYELSNDQELWRILKEVKEIEPKQSRINIKDTVYGQKKTEAYSCDEFSMDIPSGWQVERTHGAGMYAGIRVYDPSDERRQLLFILKAEPLLHDESGQQYYAMNGNDSFAHAPVLYNASTEGFFQIFGNYADLLQNYVVEYDEMNVPRFEEFKTIESVSNPNALQGSVNSDILRADFTVSGKPAEGLFAADIYDFSKDTGVSMFGDFGHYSAYNIYAMSTEKDALIDWQPLLNECISSLAFTEEYINTATAQSKESVVNAKYISEANQQILSGIMSSWESRNTSQDILSQKQSDATLGYERVIDTDTGEIYKAYNGFMDDYSGTRFEAITDAQYAEPTSGYIE